MTSNQNRSFSTLLLANKKKAFMNIYTPHTHIVIYIGQAKERG